MSYHPPSGARDLLPLDVAQKQWIETRLEAVFQRWGYHRIMTSTVESLETLSAGGAIDSTSVVEFRGAAGERLGLRPELTASIARTAVTRMERVSYPQRLYYTANVFRQAATGSLGGQQELHQAGVELLGVAGGWADAEVLLLLADCLDSLPLGPWRIVLGNADLTRSLLSVFPQELQRTVRTAIAQLDRVTLETLPLAPDLRQRALLLLDLRGRPADVFQTLGQLPLTPEEQAMVTDIKHLFELLEATESRGEAAPSLVPAITFDLSLVQTFDYYTGLVFEVVSLAHNQCQVLGKGGRYDHLLGVFHPQNQSFPGVGFMLSMEDLHQALLPTGHLPRTPTATDWLVVPRTSTAVAAAFAYAKTIRASTSLVQVEVQVTPNVPDDRIRETARQRQISRIAWIAEDGTPEIEALP